MVRHRAIILGLAFLLACGADTPQQTANDSADRAQLTDENVLLLAATRVGLPPSGATAADLPQPGSAGSAAVAEFCSRCHAIPHPSAHSATDWPVVLRRMWMRIDKVAPEFNVPRPTAGDRVVMLRYLEENALKVSAATLPQLQGRNSFIATCGRCHELPDPKQHSANDWVAVVDRMSRRMQEMLGEVPDRQTLMQIEIYLAGASRQSAP